LLQIAVETGFHSLVELIAKHEGDQASKNAALADAVALRRLDFVELLVENGAEITSVPLADVLITWEPKLIRFFLELGARKRNESGASQSSKGGHRRWCSYGRKSRKKRKSWNNSIAGLKAGNVRKGCDGS
jgi:hypothetical protein